MELKNMNLNSKTSSTGWYKSKTLKNFNKTKKIIKKKDQLVLGVMPLKSLFPVFQKYKIICNSLHKPPSTLFNILIKDYLKKLYKTSGRNAMNISYNI